MISWIKGGRHCDIEIKQTEYLKSLKVKLVCCDKQHSTLSSSLKITLHYITITNALF